MRRDYQVIVIGGGHAGVEAAWAAANLLPGNATVALVTIEPTKIGVMSCNPANGGLAKGQLVREIDALGGVMGLATDATGIQFRMLNTSKGPAVHGPRAQCDKHAYAEAVQLLIASRPEIEVVAGTVERLLIDGEGSHRRVVGVEVAITPGFAPIGHPIGPTASPGVPGGTSPGSITLHAPGVVLTTGTFMRGLMHTGELKTEGGRAGEAAAVGISGALSNLGFELGRLKTGTPPRLKRSTIRWEELASQPGDDDPVPFSDLTMARGPSRGSPPSSSARVLQPAHGPWREWGDAGRAVAREALLSWRDADFVLDRFPLLPQVECRQSSTCLAAHEVIRANLHRAPMFSGQIESVGPRYCPSIEDKVVRFAGRDSHGVFLEPESLRDDWIYCNGVSTSLPRDVQDAIVRSMPGCERAEILRYGYAVEYDMVRPHQIEVTGQTRPVRGLFLAGQINGTSGYEEAAAQGLVAGINAARQVRAEGEFILARDQAYIGVLMDDLCTKTPVEPYRMFTSRAEHRLLLRADNAAERLTPLAMELGLLGSSVLGKRRARAFESRRQQAEALDALVASTRYDGIPLSKHLRSDRFSISDMRTALAPQLHSTIFDDSVFRVVHAERRYEAYIVRQRAEIKRQAELEHRRLPDEVPYDRFESLRTEARQALSRFRPRTFGQAARLEGITPADITLLAVLVQRWGRERAGS